jgi:hypothetical protein
MAVGCMVHIGTMIDIYTILFGKSEGKTSLGRPRCRWEDNIGMSLREYGVTMRIEIVAQDQGQWWAIVNTVLKLWISQNVIIS